MDPGWGPEFSTGGHGLAPRWRRRCHADVRRAISIKFCMVIEVVRAIILGPKRFWVPSIV